MNNDTEISKPETAAPLPSSSFAQRLRDALENLDEGQYFTIRTIKERTYITNLIGQVQKKNGMRFKTALLVRREADPEGKIVLQISRVAAPQRN